MSESLPLIPSVLGLPNPLGNPPPLPRKGCGTPWEGARAVSKAQFLH